MADPLTFWKAVKCVRCHNAVKNPVQLPACLHVLCLECERHLEAASAYNIYCPKCKVENARPKTLQLISGVERANGESLPCDNPEKHANCSRIAQWNCFECGNNLCGSCRLSHSKDHKIQLLLQPENLRNKIWEHTADVLDALSSLTLTTDQEDNRSGHTRDETTICCPVCNHTSCEHVQKLMNLFKLYTSDCDQEGHVDKELKYFCKECWVPVCGDCSQKGKHKLHVCDDLSSCAQEFITKSVAALKEEMCMLIESSKQHVLRAENDEKRLKQHVNDTELELNARKRKILEETEQAFNNAIRDAELQGDDILADYKGRLNLCKKFELFFLKIKEAITKFTIDEQQPTTAQYVVAFYLQKFASELIPHIQDKYEKLEIHQERQFVLPEMEVNSVTPPPTLARVGTEWKQMKLAFFFKCNDFYSVKSIVITGKNSCLLSTKKLVGRSQYDSIVECQYNRQTKEVDFVEYDTHRGDYFISQLQSGEIIASYTCPEKDRRAGFCNAVKYCSKLPQNANDVMDMRIIKEFQFPPYSIATTKENNILLCVNADEKKGLSYLMLLNLLGNELKSTVKQQGPNMISPNYVAVSNSGEICVSDTEGSSVVILDENLSVRERVNYQLPTSLKDPSDYPFQPEGVCYDSYGRIIVADSKNSCIVRLLKAPGSSKYKLEPLLSENDGIPGFCQPHLVAMGKDSRLWVVCAEYIFVFNYAV
ncbi:hypothetical protein BsWGS_22478 [Bradybaena similaris]